MFESISIQSSLLKKLLWKHLESHWMELSFQYLNANALKSFEVRKSLMTAQFLKWAIFPDVQYDNAMV